MKERIITNFVLFGIGVLVILAGYHWFDPDDNKIYSLTLYYFGSLILIFSLPNWKVFDPLKSLAQISIVILKLTSTFLTSFLIVNVALLIPYFLITALLRNIPETLFNVSLEPQLELYLAFSLTAIIVTIFGEKLMLFVTKWIFITKRQTKIKSNYELALGFVNKDRIRFAIFFLYFIHMIYFSIDNLNGSLNLLDEQTNFAILHSFATYLAFDQLLTNKALIGFKPKELFQKLKNTWKADGWIEDKVEEEPKPE